MSNVKTIHTNNPKKAAEDLRLVLATNLGYTSHFATFGPDHVRLVASDGKVVDFIKEVK